MMIITFEKPVAFDRGGGDLVWLAVVAIDAQADEVHAVLHTPEVLFGRMLVIAAMRIGANERCENRWRATRHQSQKQCVITVAKTNIRSVVAAAFDRIPEEWPSL